MMKKILLTLVCLLSALSLLGVPAKPGSFKYTQPDGSVISLWRHGDEFGHWLTDNQGRVVRKEADGFYRVDAMADLASLHRTAMEKRQQANRQRRTRRGSGSIATGDKHYLVILVEFKDCEFTVTAPNASFSDMLNVEGYTDNDATGSARDYYMDNSHDEFRPHFDVYGPATLDNTKAYYGGNTASGDDKCPEQAVKEALVQLQNQINFSQYDNDGDGEVDLVFMYYAGHGEADSDDEDAIWPHQWSFDAAGLNLTLGGKKINNYACTNELNGGTVKMCGIGTACHEFGHAMGLPDFYDVDYDTNDECGGLYDFSLMCSGSYNNDGRTPPYLNIEERLLLGWLKEEDAFEDITESRNYVLPSIQSDKAFRTATDQDGEYFVYECRANTGWDASLPAHGMIVYHVDKSDRTVKIDGMNTAPTAAELWSNWQATNAINENGSHPCFYVVPAYGQDDLMFGYEYYGNYMYFDPYGKGYARQMPFPGSQGVTDFTAKSWNGILSSVSLSQIAYNDGKVTFTASVAKAGLDYPVIRDRQNGTYVTGSSLDLLLDVPDGMSVKSVAWSFDDQPTTAGTVNFTQAGDHTVEATVTLQDGRVLTVTLDVHVN